MLKARRSCPSSSCLQSGVSMIPRGNEEASIFGTIFLSRRELFPLLFFVRIIIIFTRELHKGFPCLIGWIHPPRSPNCADDKESTYSVLHHPVTA